MNIFKKRVASLPNPTQDISDADSAALFKSSNRTALEKCTHLYDDTQGTIKINKIINEKKNEKGIKLVIV